MTDYYGSVTDADAYHAARGNAAWGDLDQGAKEAALLRASDVLDGRGPFTGVQTDPGEVRSWPRDNVEDRCAGVWLDDGVVPVKIENATYELALVEAVSPGALSPVTGRATVQETVDVISVTYAKGDTGEGQVEFPLAADRLIRCFTVPAAAARWLSRG